MTTSVQRHPSVAEQCAAAARLRHVQPHGRQAPFRPRLRRRGQHTPGLEGAVPPAPGSGPARAGSSRRGHRGRVGAAPPGAGPAHRQTPVQLGAAGPAPHVARPHHAGPAALRAQPRARAQGGLVHVDRRGDRARQAPREAHHGAARHGVRGRGAPRHARVRGQPAQGAEHGAPVRGGPAPYPPPSGAASGSATCCGGAASRAPPTCA
jgi:hypothetical protein